MVYPPFYHTFFFEIKIYAVLILQKIKQHSDQSLCLTFLIPRIIQNPGENRKNILVITTFLANMIQSVFKFGMTKPTAVCFPNYKSFMTAVKSVFMIIWPHHWQDFLHLAITRSSCWDVFCKKGVLKIFGVYFLTHLFQCIHSLTVF